MNNTKIKTIALTALFAMILALAGLQLVDQSAFADGNFQVYLPLVEKSDPGGSIPQ